MSSQRSPGQPLPRPRSRFREVRGVGSPPLPRTRTDVADRIVPAVVELGYLRCLRLEPVDVERIGLDVEVESPRELVLPRGPRLGCHDFAASSVGTKPKCQNNDRDQRPEPRGSGVSRGHRMHDRSIGRRRVGLDTR